MAFELPKVKVPSIKDVLTASNPLTAQAAILDKLGVKDALLGGKKPDISAERAAQQKAIEDWLASQPKDFQQDKWLGDLTPEEYAAAQAMGPSALESISQDPRLQDAQMQALQGLQDRSQSGYNIEDRAAIEQALGEARRQEGSQRAALMQNMQARGMGGSGAELASQLANQQGSANRSSQAALDVAAEGRRRALEAMMQSGNMAGNMQQADFGRQAQIATAKDRINQFNTENLNRIAEQNTALRNQAMAANMAGRQGVASGNVQGQNAFNQQKFGNVGEVAKVQSNNATDSINQKMKADAAKGNVLQNMISGAAAGGQAGGPWGAAAGAAGAGVLTNEQNKRR